MRGNLRFPATLESIGEYAFYQNEISSLVIEPSVTSIGEYAFQYCKSLKSVDFRPSMTLVPNDCFEYCSALETVSGLDGNITTFGSYAFHDCSALQSVGAVQPQVVNRLAFCGCKVLQAIDLSLATTIGDAAFNNCDALTSVDFTNLTSIGSEAFRNCDGLTSVTFNDKITEIASSAFSECSQLATINLGASVRSLGSSCFNTGKSSLTAIYVKSPTPPTVSTSSSYYPFYERKATLYVPEYAMVSYKLADYWSAFTSVEPNPYPATEMNLYGALELTSNARIPDMPNMTLGWSSSTAAGASLVVNGDKTQLLGAFLQYVSHYKYSSYDPCSASLISRCANMTSVSSEVRFWCDRASTYWYYVCMPFDVLRSSIYTRNGAEFAVRYYDGESRAENGAGSSWKDVGDNDMLRAGQGYIFCVSKADYICLPATRESHDRIFTSTAIATELADYASTTTANAGWNLVGNPYPSFYDIYYMDYTAPITVWDTTNKTFAAYSVADDDLALYPLQAFFVQKPSGVDGVTFQPEGRQRTLNIEHEAQTLARKSRAHNVARAVINLALSNGEAEDMTRIVVNPQASDDFEAETDAAKMMSCDSTPQLYSLRGDVQYAINEGAQTGGMVRLGIWTPADGQYTLDLRRADTDVELYDNGVAVDMPYTFSAAAGSDDSRFSLKIGSEATGIERPGGETAGNGAQTAGGGEGGTQTAGGGALFDLSGRRVGNAAKKGVYIQNGKKVVK